MLSTARRAVGALSATVLILAGAVTLAPIAGAAPVPLISTAGTTWRYLDDGNDPSVDPDARTKPGLDAAAWTKAKGSFGTLRGAIGELSGGYTPKTLLSQYASGVPAFFFRTEITVTAEQLGAARSATAEVLYDDRRGAEHHARGRRGREEAEPDLVHQR